MSIPPIMPRNFTVFDAVSVCAMTKEQCVQEIFQLARERADATVMLLGVPAVVSARENPQIASMYNQATIALMDGMPLVKAARRQGLACECCAGPDIMGLIFAESVRRHTKHYFYGGKDQAVLQRLRENLEEEYPGIQIAGMHSPPFRPLTNEEDLAICKEINALQPDFLWIGIGAPKQERWMQAHQEKMNGAVMLGIGAAFDFFAGTLDRAPAWMRRCGLEWFFRLIKEPRRLWRRYLIGGVKYVYYSAAQKIAKSMGRTTETTK